MTLSVTPKTITISNGDANDASVVNNMFADCYTNDSTIASYVNAHCALIDSPQTFTATQTFTAKPVSTKGVNLAQASEPTSPAIADFWYSSTNNVFEGLVQAGTISGATNASPIVITTASAHGLGTGQTAYISGVLGNTAANGSFTITVISSTTFSLDGSTGNGAYTSGGTVSTIQTIKQGSPVVSVSAISSNPTANVTDKGKLYVCTSTFTFGLTAAAILGSAWYCYIRNDGTGIITIDPNSTETIDGQTTINVYQGEAFTLVCDGTNFKTVGRTPGRVLIQTQTANNVASVDFTVGIDSTFDHYVLEGIGIVAASNTNTGLLRTSADGSTWDAGTGYEWWGAIVESSSSVGATGASAMQVTNAGTMSNAAGKALDFVAEFFNPSSSSLHKFFSIQSTYYVAANAGGGVFTGIRNSTTAVTGVRFLFNTGNITSGTFNLYGVRK